jgi:hypothetical protein
VDKVRLSVEKRRRVWTRPARTVRAAVGWDGLLAGLARRHPVSRLHPQPLPCSIHGAWPAVHRILPLAHYGCARDLRVGAPTVHTTVMTMMIMNRYDEEHCIDTAPRRAAGPRGTAVSRPGQDR